MNELTKKELLESKVNCINKVHSYINKTVPLLIEELKKGYKTTVNNELFKKDKERINKIINANDHFRACLDMSSCSIWLKVDNTYKTSQYSCNYYKKNIYLFNRVEDREGATFEPLKMVSVEMLEHAEIELKKAKEEKEKIESKINRLKTLLNTNF